MHFLFFNDDLLAMFYAIIGFVPVGLALTYIFCRPLLPVRVNCCFCNNTFWVPFAERNRFDCRNCHQYNDKSEEAARTKRLCPDCTIKQNLKSQKLASFVPLNEKNYDSEIDCYSKRLEDAYRLCDQCISMLTSPSGAALAPLLLIQTASQKFVSSLCTAISRSSSVLLLLISSVSSCADSQRLLELYPTVDVEAAKLLLIITLAGSISSIVSMFVERKFEGKQIIQTALWGLMLSMSYTMHAYCPIILSIMSAMSYITGRIWSIKTPSRALPNKPLASIPLTSIMPGPSATPYNPIGEENMQNALDEVCRGINALGLGFLEPGVGPRKPANFLFQKSNFGTEKNTNILWQPETRSSVSRHGSSASPAYSSSSDAVSYSLNSPTPTPSVPYSPPTTPAYSCPSFSPPTTPAYSCPSFSPPTTPAYSCPSFLPPTTPAYSCPSFSPPTTPAYSCPSFSPPTTPAYSCPSFSPPTTPAYSCPSYSPPTTPAYSSSSDTVSYSLNSPTPTPSVPYSPPTTPAYSSSSDTVSYSLNSPTPTPSVPYSPPTTPAYSSSSDTVFYSLNSPTPTPSVPYSPPTTPAYSCPSYSRCDSRCSLYTPPPTPTPSVAHSLPTTPASRGPSCSRFDSRSSLNTLPPTPTPSMAFQPPIQPAYGYFYPAPYPYLEPVQYTGFPPVYSAHYPAHAPFYFPPHPPPPYYPAPAPHGQMWPHPDSATQSSSNAAQPAHSNAAQPAHSNWDWVIRAGVVIVVVVVAVGLLTVEMYFKNWRL